MFRSYHATVGRRAAGRCTYPVTLFLAIAFVLVGALAGAPVPASASPLDLGYQPLAFHTATTGEINTEGNVPLLFQTYAAAESRPIRRSRPRYRERERDRYDSDRYTPRYFAAIGGGNFDPDEQPGNGLWVSGEMGSEVGEALDLGVRLSLYHRESGRSQVVSEYTDPAGNVGHRVVETNSVETNLIPLMAILRVRFPVTREFQPYVGGGIGWEWLTVEGTDDAGFAFQDDYDGLGMQLFGGLNLGVSQNLALYGEGVWNKSTVEAEFYDPFFGGDVKEEIEMDGLALHGGLRFRF
jgi:opacity protein-like surface antigen